MNRSNPTLKRFGLVLFSIGVLLAFVLSGLMVWADVEAFSYGFPRLGNDPMRGLSCPPLINRNENSSFSLTLKNTTEGVLRPQVQVLISETGLSRWRTITTLLEMEPGERETVTWELDANNIVLGSFVFVKAYTYASYPLPNIEGSCGIFVVSIPWLNAAVLFWLWLGLSLVFLITGLWLTVIRPGESVQSSANTLVPVVFAALAVLGLISGILGWWPVGIFVLLMIALALPAVLFFWHNR